jgi:biopolymer transport protein ExbD
MAFQPSRAKKHFGPEKGGLNMNAMMDMMTIILLFLLKSFSTEGSLVTASEQLKLPQSHQGEKPKKELNVSVAKDVILVNDAVVFPLDQLTDDMIIIPALYEKLDEYAQREQDLEIEVGKEFTHIVIIQGDQKVPFELLYKVMYTCSQSQFYKMRLLTVKLEG